MKICVYFHPKAKFDNYEGSRLRKNIKGALELNNIPFAKDIIDSFDVAHFITPDDETKIDSIKELGIPVVFSALYCENDVAASLISSIDKDNALSLKAIRTLNKADVVLVSDKLSRDTLLNNGVISKIEIVSPGVNISRFEFSSQLEEKIFFNYFQLEPNKKFAVTYANIKDTKTRKNLISIARLCPDVIFIALGNKSIGRISRIRKSIPRNIKLSNLVNNDIYCSMMRMASVVLYLDNRHHSPISLLDAAASKTQVVSLGPAGLNEEYLEAIKANICNNIDDVTKVINEIATGKSKIVNAEAYEFAKENSLKVVGKQLITIYKNLLGDKTND